MHDDLAEARALGFQFLPKPFSHVLNRWILQALNFIQVCVVENFQKWFHGLADLRMVVNPAGFWIDVSLDRHFDFKTMSVHPATFVTLRGVGQSLCRFESEVLRQARAHMTKTIIACYRLSSGAKLREFVALRSRDSAGFLDFALDRSE